MKDFIWQMLGGEQITQIMSLSAAGNTVGKYSMAAILFCLLWALIRGFRLVGLRKLRRWADATPYQLDSKIFQWAAEISPLFFAYLSFFVVVKYFLAITTTLAHVLTGAFILLLIFEATRIIQKIVAYALHRTPLGKNKTTLHGVQRLCNILIWLIALLVILSNFGVNVTTLVASFGIGGIAIAFALQSILADIFASFSIYFDKPFEEGDYIAVGDHEGEIKQIGLKTTRIQAFHGEEIVISNKELTESRVNNYQKLNYRLDDLMIEISFDTPLKKLKQVPEILREVIDSCSGVKFDRVHLYKIEKSSYVFALVYHVDTGSWIEYLNAREAVHWGILDTFEKNKIEFALPTEVRISRTEK